MSWSKFVNTHLYHSRQWFNIHLYTYCFQPVTLLTGVQCVFVTAGVEESQTATWVTLIVVGGIVCIAIIIIVGILLHRTITHRKKAKHLDLINRYVRGVKPPRSETTLFVSGGT